MDITDATAYKKKVYIKIWLSTIIIFSIIVIIINYVIVRSDYGLSHIDTISHDYDYIYDLSPKYPPPLFNFINYT